MPFDILLKTYFLSLINLGTILTLLLLIGHSTTDWFQIGKGERQGCILSPCLFNFYAPSSRDEGLRLLHGLDTSLATSLQTPQEA